MSDTAGQIKPKWWLATILQGHPVTLEILTINGDPVSPDSTRPPEIKPEDVVVVDRGIMTLQMATPRGMQTSVADIRAALGFLYMPQDGDLSKSSNRRPVSIRGEALFQGPYLWVDITDLGEQQLVDMAEKLYSPPSPIVQPDKRILGVRPGALQAMGHAFGGPDR